MFSLLLRLAWNNWQKIFAFLCLFVLLFWFYFFTVKWQQQPLFFNVMFHHDYLTHWFPRICQQFFWILKVFKKSQNPRWQILSCDARRRHRQKNLFSVSFAITELLALWSTRRWWGSMYSLWGSMSSWWGQSGENFSSSAFNE